MTAPAAPTIKYRQNGQGVIRVSWPAVPTATYYKVYTGETPSPTDVYATILAAQAEVDGSFHCWIDDAPSGLYYVRVTAFNVGDEESAYSTQYQVNVHIDSEVIPTDALRHIMKGANDPPR